MVKYVWDALHYLERYTHIIPLSEHLGDATLLYSILWSNICIQ